MKVLLELLEWIGSGVQMSLRTLRFVPSLPWQWKRLVDQCLFMGYATVPLVAILSFFIGAVLALQIGYSILDFGAQQYIGTIVGLSMIRELSPVMTAVMVTGRVGSAVTAELGSMKVYQEVDALKTMNIPPERFLVLPRLAAIVLVMPILLMVSVVTGWIGGQVVCETVPWIGLSSESYYNSLKSFMQLDDITDGLVKAELFGIGILLISSHLGLRTTGGPREIGAAVTRAVVVCIIFVLIFDYFITNILI
ncbi:MAG: MlaE family ABC transporter permease [Opitutales bacterium]|jgi:phospholipid/cholesterol/gamma-HCH transport system permease protein